jgi:hypothetical protein
VWGECGAVKLGYNQPALRALFACESGLLEPEIELEHAFVLLIWQKKQDKWQNSHGARSQKQLHWPGSNSFCHFHLILSVSRPQGLLNISLKIV